MRIEPDRNDLFDPNEEEELDPLFQEAREQARRRDFQASMHELKQRWRAGDMTALVPAVWEMVKLLSELGEKTRQELGDYWWVEDAVKQLVDRRLPAGEKRLRREFDNHLRRWEAIVELYERRYELAKLGDVRGMTLEDCFLAVSELSWDFNPEAAGGVETMERSYYLIEAAGGEHATLEKFKSVRHQSWNK